MRLRIAHAIATYLETRKDPEEEDQRPLTLLCCRGYEEGEVEY